MDPKSGYCLGCARTIEEIAGWSQATSAQRLAVLAQLAQRREQIKAPV
jgi:uncharacterized protein